MHTTEGQKYRYFHNGSFDGDIHVADKATGDILIKIPFNEIKLLVAKLVRTEKITRLDHEIEQIETASDDEVLWIIPSGENILENK